MLTGTAKVTVQGPRGEDLLQELALVVIGFDVRHDADQEIHFLRAELAGSDDRYQQALLAFWTAKADFENAIGEEVIP